MELGVNASWELKKGNKAATFALVSEVIFAFSVTAYLTRLLPKQCTGYLYSRSFLSHCVLYGSVGRPAYYTRDILVEKTYAQAKSSIERYGHHRPPFPLDQTLDCDPTLSSDDRYGS
jgi:hypothetical protein